MKILAKVMVKIVDPIVNFIFKLSNEMDMERKVKNG